eukprot:TRINITY_DN14722_c0_g1_i1.p1 TRINITY_DN14722_c0_g1~~TRINITY_DN14722_c0_g1_i1.p1  ORF type:complete len:111 (-),score=20.49 TRINITY_DN14722_c0_g1_i1:27-359(-)
MISHVSAALASVFALAFAFVSVALPSAISAESSAVAGLPFGFGLASALAGLSLGSAFGISISSTGFGSSSGILFSARATTFPQVLLCPYPAVAGNGSVFMKSYEDYLHVL